MSRLSRAMWRLVPTRTMFRPDGSMTRFGRWSFGRILRKLPKREFIAATERHGEDVDDYTMCICGTPADHHCRDEEVKPIQTDRPAT